jgi:hypothetical protein
MLGDPLQPAVDDLGHHGWEAVECVGLGQVLHDHVLRQRCEVGELPGPGALAESIRKSPGALRAVLAIDEASEHEGMRVVCQVVQECVGFR